MIMISYNILQKRLIFQIYKKMFSRKIRHVAIRSGSIRWISIRFDAVLDHKPFHFSHTEKKTEISFLSTNIFFNYGVFYFWRGHLSKNLLFDAFVWSKTMSNVRKPLCWLFAQSIIICIIQFKSLLQRIKKYVLETEMMSNLIQYYYVYN